MTGHFRARHFLRRKGFHDSKPNTVRLGCSWSSGRGMTQPEDRASAGRCDADTQCLHMACFQVQLDSSCPRQAHRRANACAYHVPDVIGALRAWAGEQGLADGQLTILAIEPAAGGRLPDQAVQAGGPGEPELQGFAFSTIPLSPDQLRSQS